MIVTSVVMVWLVLVGGNVPAFGPYLLVGFFLVLQPSNVDEPGRCHVHVIVQPADRLG